MPYFRLHIDRNPLPPIREERRGQGAAMTYFKSLGPPTFERGSRGETRCERCKRILVSNDSKEHGRCGMCARDMPHFNRRYPQNRLLKA